MNNPKKPPALCLFSSIKSSVNPDTDARCGQGLNSCKGMFRLAEYERESDLTIQLKKMLINIYCGVTLHIANAKTGHISS